MPSGTLVQVLIMLSNERRTREDIEKTLRECEFSREVINEVMTCVNDKGQFVYAGKKRTPIFPLAYKFFSKSEDIDDQYWATAQQIAKKGRPRDEDGNRTEWEGYWGYVGFGMFGDTF